MPLRAEEEEGTLGPILRCFMLLDSAADFALDRSNPTNLAPAYSLAHIPHSAGSLIV